MNTNNIRPSSEVNAGSEPGRTPLRGQGVVGGLGWGWRITMLYSGFVIMMLFLVWKTTTVKDDLVTPDYYAKELKFQDQLDKQKRTHELKEQPQWNVNGKKIAIQFPAELVTKNVKAEILFYNAAEAKRDFTISCSPDSNGNCEVSSDKFQHGVYQMKMDWSAGGVSYFNEGTINIQ